MENLTFKNIIIIFLGSWFFFLINFFCVLFLKNYISIYNLFIDSNVIFANIDQKKTKYFSGYLSFLYTYIICIVYYITKNLLKIYTIQCLFKTTFITILISFIFMVCCSIIVSFFFMYETVLLPSVILLFLTSSNKRSATSATYFLLWTQLGSFFVLSAIILFTFLLQCLYFVQIEYLNKLFLKKIALYFIIIGFGVKTPVWPFHFWLTKTHVEANTSFSIVLSGLLVKTSTIGFLKFSCLFQHYKVAPLISLVLWGVYDIAFKLNFQIDFKKLIAYLTIQEMSLLTLFTFWNEYHSIIFFIKFILLHTTLSGLLFFTVEIVYCRLGTRQLNFCQGFITNKPIFNGIFICLIFCFIGIPLSLKMFIEVIIIFKYLCYDFLLLSKIVIIIQGLTIVIFGRNTLLLIFGRIYSISTDLTKIESLSFLYFFIPLIAIIY